MRKKRSKYYRILAVAVIIFIAATALVMRNLPKSTYEATLKTASRNNLDLICRLLYRYIEIKGYKDIPTDPRKLYELGYIDSENVIKNPIDHTLGYRIIPFTEHDPDNKIIIIEEPGAWKDVIYACRKDLSIVVLPPDTTLGK